MLDQEADVSNAAVGAVIPHEESLSTLRSIGFVFGRSGVHREPDDPMVNADKSWPPHEMASKYRLAMEPPNPAVEYVPESTMETASLWCKPQVVLPFYCKATGGDSSLLICDFLTMEQQGSWRWTWKSSCQPTLRNQHKTRGTHTYNRCANEKVS